MRDWRVVLEVIPTEDGPHFRDYACAVANFYVRCAGPRPIDMGAVPEMQARSGRRSRPARRKAATDAARQGEIFDLRAARRRHHGTGATTALRRGFVLGSQSALTVKWDLHPIDIADRELRLKGWEIATTLECETIVSDRELRQTLDRGQCLCDLRRVRRLTESIIPCELPPVPDFERLYFEFLFSLRSAGYLLRDQLTREFVTLVSHGQRILPLWKDTEHADVWRKHLGGDIIVQSLRPTELRSTLSRHDCHETMLGLGLAPSVIMTFHPHAIIRSLTS